MTRRTAFNGSAAGRRRERRAALQNDTTASSEVLHRPTLSRVQIQAKGKHETPSVLKTQNHFSSWRKMHSGNWKNTDAIWSGQPLCTQMSLVTNLLKLACVYQMLRSTMLVTEEQSM